jgi:hypothetical protein
MREDRSIVRELAQRYAQIATLPVQEEKMRLWRGLNGLKPERPMVMIDQICWSEIDDSRLALHCEGAEYREYERFFRRVLYQWEHFPVDMVVEPVIRVPMAVQNSGFGIDVVETTLRSFEDCEIASHRYTNLFRGIDDVGRLHSPDITHDMAETRRRFSFAESLFGDILDLSEEGYDPYLSIWDPISTWMGAEGVLYAAADQPELLHALAKKVADCYLSMLDQLEAQGLLCHNQSLIHCTGAYTDELPAPGFDPKRPRTKDLWMAGLAQVFAAVSPAMFDALEIAYSMPLFERFGLVYYGCCDPLHQKMAETKRIPNVRKISVSPWADQRKCAEEIGEDFVFSRKPNPALLAMDSFDGDLVTAEFKDTLRVCKQCNCPVEFILKDISTIRQAPERLARWADIAMDAVCG